MSRAELDERDSSVVDALREDIARTRAEIAGSTQALREELAVRLDWREWVRRNPTPCLGAALAVGFLIGFRRT